MSSENCLFMSITGQIEWVDILSSANCDFHCKYDIAYGPDWKNIKGLDAAVSQIVTTVRNGEKIVFNLPIDIVFKSTNPYQWPQIVFSVYKNMNLVGYGRTFVPTQPNLHSIDVVLLKPVPSTFLGYIASFFGYQPELIQPKMLATTLGNEMILMISNGKLRVSLNVIQQGFLKMGYDVGKRK